MMMVSKEWISSHVDNAIFKIENVSIITLKRIWFGVVIIQP